MSAKELFTYSFAKNVGNADRVFRIASGLALALVGVFVDVPRWALIAMAIFGTAWALTGVLSRCSVYYLLGYSTCPVDRPNPTEVGRKDHS